MIVAKTMNKKPVTKNMYRNTVHATKGMLNKQFPELHCDVIVKDGQFEGETTYGLEFPDDGTRIWNEGGRKFHLEIKEYLMQNGWIKSFIQTVKDVLSYLDKESEWKDLDEVPVASLRIVKEENDCEMYHSLILNEAKKNCPYKWTEREDIYGVVENFIKANSHIWGIFCWVGYDPFQESFVSIRKCDVSRFKNLLRKMFIEPTEK